MSDLTKAFQANNFATKYLCWIVDRSNETIDKKIIGVKNVRLPDDVDKKNVGQCIYYLVKHLAHNGLEPYLKKQGFADFVPYKTPSIDISQNSSQTIIEICIYVDKNTHDTIMGQKWIMKPVGPLQKQLKYLYAAHGLDQPYHYSL